MFFSLFAGKNPSQTSFDGNSGHVWIRIWSIRKKWLWAASHQLCKWEDATGNNFIFIQYGFCLVPSLSCPIMLCAHFYTNSESYNVHFNMHSTLLSFTIMCSKSTTQTKIITYQFLDLFPLSPRYIFMALLIQVGWTQTCSTSSTNSFTDLTFYLEVNPSNSVPISYTISNATNCNQFHNLLNEMSPLFNKW